MAHLINAAEYPLLYLSAGLLVAIAIVLAVVRVRTRLAEILAIGTASVAAAVAVYAGVGRAVLDGYDVRPIARPLAEIQRAGHAIAHHGKYHGQFQFVGRLTQPLEVVQGPDALRLWAERHPEGSVVVYSYKPLEHPTAQPQASQRFKGRYVYVWRARDLSGVSDAWTRGRSEDDPQ